MAITFNNLMINSLDKNFNRHWHLWTIILIFYLIQNPYSAALATLSIHVEMLYNFIAPIHNKK